jgi:hypothetical protein
MPGVRCFLCFEIGESKMELSQTDRIERYKIGLEYLKHITTLATGSIVLIATFLEKLFATLLWKAVIVVSLIGFMVSVLSATISYTLSIAFRFPGEWDDNVPEWSRTIGGVSVLFTWVGFLVGILSLAVFAIRNFIQ